MNQVLCHRSRSVGGTAVASYTTFPASTDTHPTEAEVTATWPTAGTFSNLIIMMAVAPGAGKSWTYTVRINGVDTSLVVTISDTAVTGRDTSHSVTVAAGDELSLKVVPSGSPTTPGNTGLMVTVTFEGTTAKESGYSWKPEAVSTTVARWNGVFASGATWNATSGATTETVVAAAGDITALYINSGLGGPGGGTKTYTVHIYKNGVKQDGTGGTVDTGVALSGAVQINSITFTLPVVAGDLLYVECVPTNTPNLMALGCGFRFVATTDGQSNFCGFSTSNMSASAARFTSPEGDVAAWDATEADVVAYAGVQAFSLSKLQVKLQGSPGAGKSYTIDARNNSASPAGTTTASVADAATTGSDSSSNSTLYVDGDTLTVQSVPSGTPTARAASWGFIQTVAAPQITGSAVFGVSTTVNATRAVAFGLDNNTNIHNETGKLKVFGHHAVTGYQELIEMTAPTGVANTARLYAVDNGSGKTRLMVIFGSGAAVQIAIEP